MVTEVSITGLAAVYASPPNSSGTPPVKGGGSDHVLSPAIAEPQIRGEFARVQAERDERSILAIGLRNAGPGLDALDARLEETKDRLTAIVKQYPPYGKDNPMRIELLNQVSGLRKQIEALSIPAEKLSERAGLPEQGPSFDFASLDPREASDEAIVATLGQVEVAQAGLAQLRNGMWADIVEADSGQSEQDAAKRTQESQAYLADSGQSLATSRELFTALG